MADIVDRATRSRMMAGIRGKDTKPERQIRSALHKRGLRYRLNVTGLPGKPDLVLRKYHAVVFVHGCFWHQHDCALFKWPSSRREFWKNKLSQNKVRDADNEERLTASGWRIAKVWECALKGTARRSVDDVADMITRWLVGKTKASLEIRGRRKK